MPPHLQKDLALRIELKSLFESFLDLVLVLRLVVVVVVMWDVLFGIKVVFAHRVKFSRIEGLMNRGDDRGVTPAIGPSCHYSGQIGSWMSRSTSGRRDGHGHRCRPPPERMKR